MIIPTDISIWLKIIGGLTSVTGTLLLAWRVKAILKWVVFTLVAHEQSISQVRKILNHEQQTDPLIEGVTKHLIDIESKLGVLLLVTGLLLLGIGMFLSAISYFFA